MNLLLLDPKVQEFIFKYTEPISKLAFSGSPFSGISTQELLQQLESRRKVEKKLPLWFTTKNIYYPPTLNLEQTSSEITAQYKAELVKGNTLADLTGGYGIDSYYFSKRVKQVDHFEHNEELSKIAKHNFKVLQAYNIACFTGNSLDLLKEKTYDMLYIDPSRRNDQKGKVFYLSDCEPNVPANLAYLYKHSRHILVKASPMLDLSIGIQELNGVKEVHCIAVKNEMKEVLFLLEESFDGIPIIKTINFDREHLQEFQFKWNQDAITAYAAPDNYLYEPNVALLKSGAFSILSEAFSIQKIHKHTHLFTSTDLIDFPGRRFKIEKIVPYQKKEIKKLWISKANISTRNFPDSVALIRKKFKIKDGGALYLFFITDLDNNRLVLSCTKV